MSSIPFALPDVVQEAINRSGPLMPLNNKEVEILRHLNNEDKASNSEEADSGLDLDDKDQALSNDAVEVPSELNGESRSLNNKGDIDLDLDGDFHAESETVESRRAADTITAASMAAVDVEAPTKQFVFVSQQQKDAIVNNDYLTLRTIRKTESADLKPNLESIQKNRESAFLEATNTTNGERFHICPSSTGFIWAMPLSIENEEDPSDGEIKTVATVSIGTYTANTNQLGISVSKWNNIPLNVTNFLISNFASRVVANMIANRLAGTRFGAALTSAISRASSGIVSTGAMTASTAGKIGGFMRGSILVSVAYLAVMFLADFLHRIYGLRVTVYNWEDNREWKIVNWYSDNAEVSEGAPDEWKPTNLPAATGFPVPGGFPIETERAATYATYTYSNDNAFLEGVGMCMKVQNVEDPKAGFYLKYLIKRFGKNKLALRGVISQPIKDYYNGEWAKIGTMVTQTNCKYTDTQIKGIATTPLSNEESRLYSFEVHIGIKPT